MTISLVFLVYFTIAVFISGFLDLKEGERILAFVWGVVLPIVIVVGAFQLVHLLGKRCRNMYPSIILWWEN